jgi:hypothetical protein
VVTDTRWAKNWITSCKDTVDTRKQAVAHNSVLDTLRSGKRVVYKDDCPAIDPLKPTS